MKSKIIDRRLITILSIVFVQMAGAALILPILPLYAERQFNMQPSTVTLLVSAYFIAQFFAGPFLGQLSDRYGRVPILIFSQIGSAVSFFMMAAAGGAGLLFAARIIDGITGGNVIVAQAYITDITPKEKRTEALGYIFAVFGIGFIVGPALGGLLSGWFGSVVPFIVAGVASAVTAVMSWLLLDETVKKGAARMPVPTGVPVGSRMVGGRVLLSPAQVLHNLPLMLVLIVAFVGQFGMGMLSSTFALYADAVLFRGYEDSVTNMGVGLLLAVVGLGQLFTQGWLLGRLKRRYGDARLVIIGTLIRTAGFVTFAVILTPWLGPVASLLFAIGMGLMMPPLQSLATRTVDDHLRGGVLGVYSSSVSLATIISTAIAGSLFEINPTIPFWAGAALSLLVILPAFQVLQMTRTGVFEAKEKRPETGS